MSIKIVHYICLFLAFVAFVLNLTANSADRWWEALEPQEFENIGLWQICFNMYRHRFDFYGKIYTGCWWLFSPEIRQLFSWVSTPWFRVVQAFSTLSMISMLFALAMVYILARSKNLGKISSRYVLTTAFVTLMSAVFMTIAVLVFGICGRNRDWMPRWQQNWFGWSFKVAIVSCILEYVVGGILLFEGTNIKLVKNYMEKMYIQKKRLFPAAPR